MQQHVNVAVFAYNEEAFIEANLHSVVDGVRPFPNCRIYVLANGCSDNTVPIVTAFARKHPQVTLLNFSIADKCNTWNNYVYEHADEADLHFFMDGDVRCAPGSFEKMADVIGHHEQATAVAGLPLSGRNKEVYNQYVRERGWIFGNLYALRGSHLRQLIRSAIRLPVGLRGNDHMITRFAHSDLTAPWNEDKSRVVFHEEAGYCFDSLSPIRPRDIGIYLRRSITYRHRELQLKRIWNAPLAELPADMDEINKDILRQLRATRIGFFDHATRQVLKRLAKMYPREDSIFYSAMLASDQPSIAANERA